MVLINPEKMDEIILNLKITAIGLRWSIFSVIQIPKNSSFAQPILFLCFCGNRHFLSFFCEKCGALYQDVTILSQNEQVLRSSSSRSPMIQWFEIVGYYHWNSTLIGDQMGTIPEFVPTISPR